MVGIESKEITGNKRNLVHDIGRALFNRVPLERININPNVITIAGGGFGAAAGLLASKGKFKEALGSFVLSGLLDGLDGYEARRQKKITLFGSFLDSVIDRVSDMAVLSGIEHYASVNGWKTASKLAKLARTTSLIPSMTRNIAERHDIQVSEHSIGSRFSRVTALMVCLAFPEEKVWNYALGFIAGSSAITGGERVIQILENIKDKPGTKNNAKADVLKDFADIAGKWAIIRLMSNSEYADLKLLREYIEKKEKLVMGTQQEVDLMAELIQTGVEGIFTSESIKKRVIRSRRARRVLTGAAFLRGAAIAAGSILGVHETSCRR